MKKIIFTLILLNGLLGFAETKGPNFDKMKQGVLSGLDERISLLQQHKSCVSSAQGPEDFKKCHEQMKTKEESLRAEHMKKRQQNIDEQIKHLQDEKEKMKERK